ncbi:MAG TPA: GNAT family N-acetyltransferase [Caulobacteraceae bacterium]|jgi:ribosomal protein S18 acetylase RimI-like enzyme
MADHVRIQPVRSAEDLSAVSALFELYAASLSVDLAYQGFRAEVTAIPGKYSPPRGELLLARGAGGEPLGCVGLRPLSPEGRCEMKRLFLLPTARGLGLGRRLTEAVIQQARRIGYRELLLDTLPTMTTAIGLYGQLGFRLVAPYYAPTPEGTVFMSLRL